MAVITGAAIAGASAIGGIVKGARGTPDKTVTQQTKLAAKTPQQLQMEQQSMQNYQRQQQLAGQLEQGIGAADAMRDPAIQAYLDQISGKAFQSTPEELANIQSLRDAMVQLGMQDVNQFTEQGLTQATSGAAARGLRGQAMGALRGDVLQQAQRQVGGISNQANVFAAQQAIDNPYKRVGAQQNALQQGLSYGDNLRQQAMNNRQMLQSPFLMQQLQQERLATGVQSSTTPGQKGGFWGGVMGGLTGAASGMGAASDLTRGYNNLFGGGIQQAQQPQQMAYNYQGYNPNSMIG